MKKLKIKLNKKSYLKKKLRENYVIKIAYDKWIFKQLSLKNDEYGSILKKNPIK